MRSASKLIIGLERRRRHRLVEGGVVVGGEGVFAAADLGDGAVELAGLVVGRALEHQMFEEMGDAGFAGRLVGAADLVPDHVGDDRRAVVGDDDHFHAVVEQEIRHLDSVGFGAAARRSDRAGHAQAPATSPAAFARSHSA